MEHKQYPLCSKIKDAVSHRDRQPVRISLKVTAIACLVLMIQIVHDIFLPKQQRLLLKSHHSVSKEGKNKSNTLSKISVFLTILIRLLITHNVCLGSFNESLIHNSLGMDPKEALMFCTEYGNT